ncbi:unnamed protein product [Rotaria sordida]|uniref:Uncharacterized protein n=1 Tax=Rotaria sordida TaxID=392033 RepID=A0A818VHS3_9BILA|nr:unnamed protein product [Rotaria sordida]CAF3707278.1 unnamed protein product [Rotaria sordida]
MSLIDLRSKYGSVDTLLLENQFDKALNELTNVINTLVNNNTLIQDKDSRNLLIVACIKRIDLNYQRKKFNDILNDIKVLESVNYNVYRNFDLFAKKLEAKSEIHKDDLNDKLQKLEVHFRLYFTNLTLENIVEISKITDSDYVSAIQLNILSITTVRVYAESFQSIK